MRLQKRDRSSRKILRTYACIVRNISELYFGHLTKRDCRDYTLVKFEIGMQCCRIFINIYILKSYSCTSTSANIFLQSDSQENLYTFAKIEKRREDFKYFRDAN